MATRIAKSARKRNSVDKKVGAAVARAKVEAPALTLGAVAPIPSSWPVKSWELQATHVWPHNRRSAERLIKLHVDELIQLNAICRIGRELVILGLGWSQFLHRHSGDVKGYLTPMAKRAAAQAQQEAAAA